MNAAAKQHIVLCEGFDDRSFWKGWLLRLRCTDPTDGGRNTVHDAWGRPVKGQGRYLFWTPAGSDVIVQPFLGRSKAREAAEEYLGGRQVYQPARVVLNLDSDGEGESDTSAEDQIRGIAKDLGAMGEDRPPFQIGNSVLYPVIWRCPDAEPTPGLPRKQTLERLVAAATLAAYPDRGPAVEVWLEAQPRGLKLPRSYSYSYYAKWHSDHGAGDLYEDLWRDEKVAAELEQRLAATGSRQIVEALVND